MKILCMLAALSFVTARRVPPLTAPWLEALGDLDENSLPNFSPRGHSYGYQHNDFTRFRPSPHHLGRYHTSPVSHHQNRYYHHTHSQYQPSIYHHGEYRRYPASYHRNRYHHENQNYSQIYSPSYHLRGDQNSYAYGRRYNQLHSHSQVHPLYDHRGYQSHPTSYHPTNYHRNGYHHQTHSNIHNTHHPQFYQHYSNPYTHASTHHYQHAKPFFQTGLHHFSGYQHHTRHTSLPVHSALHHLAKPSTFDHLRYLNTPFLEQNTNDTATLPSDQPILPPTDYLYNRHRSYPSRTPYHQLNRFYNSVYKFPFNRPFKSSYSQPLSPVIPF
ncbi:hypothetical protein SK128_007352 [Halocaridina rubra]|uniref:Histidine-rich glycoprotein-like n=1 Tax=Halocaridina rubra TaxID=373956 RepID=A0AAN8WKF6_HALRR